jgi:pimeloyl-ACP methyl ester carboxylesterase
LTDFTIRLPDGRNLGYAWFGDEGAPPVLYCHGWPSSRLEAGLIPGLPVRLLAFDRPGYGNSDPDRGASLLSRAKDIECLLDALGLERLPAIGVSGGGPLAAAIAMTLPWRVSALALACAVPPPEAARGEGLRLLLHAGRHPLLFTPMMHAVRTLIRTQVLGEHALLYGGLPVSDLAVLTPALRAGLVEAMREGLRHGVAGAMEDARLYGAEWGFSPADLRIPVDVWHGAADHLVPVGCAAALATAPGATRTVLDGLGHYALAFGHAPTVVRQLLARAAGG